MRVVHKMDSAERTRFGDVHMGQIFEIEGRVCIKIWGRDAVDLESGRKRDVGFYDTVRLIDAELHIA